MAEDTLRIADRIAIEDALCRYARGVDRKDWALFRSAYHDDATDDHGDMKGTTDALVAAIEERHKTVAQSLHALHKTFIEFAGPASAVVETSFTVVQSLGVEAAAYRDTLADMPLADDEMLLLRVWGRYVDLFTQNRGAWRIQRRSVVIEQSITERSRSKFREGWIAARRDGADVIELLRREVGLCS